jgi:hypothetical protein
MRQKNRPDVEIPRLTVFKKFILENCEECNFNSTLIDELFKRKESIDSDVCDTSRSRVESY